MNDDTTQPAPDTPAHDAAAAPPVPKIAIVGRPNVGKSSLLNRLAGRRISIVDPTAGVTRDRVSTVVQLPNSMSDPQDRLIELIDTGGYGIEDTDRLTTQIEFQIALGVAEADLVLFVVDGQQGVLPLDQRVAKLLRDAQLSAPIVLVANKVDEDHMEGPAFDVMQLGFGEPVMVSATTKKGIADLGEVIREQVDFDAPRSAALGGRSALDTGIQLAIVGKRNAGKSTLVNALARAERVIVSEVEGTTRDAVDVRMEVGGHVLTAIDTAGLRKRKSVKGDIEYYSHHRSLRAVRRADVCLMLFDATVPLSQVDRQLAQEIVRHFKPTVLVVNKWDLAEAKYTQEEFLEYLDEAMKGLSFAPVAFISAQKGEGIEELIDTAVSLHEQAGQRVSTGELNRIVEEIIASSPPTSRLGKRSKVYYVTQLEANPPTIGLFVNDPDLFDPAYQRFIINRLRDELPYPEVPIKLLIRERKRAPREG